jgi:hypothetical protein
MHVRVRVCVWGEGSTDQLSRAYVKRMVCWPLEYILWFLFELIVCANHEFPLFNYSLDGMPRFHGFCCGLCFYTCVVRGVSLADCMRAVLTTP